MNGPVKGDFETFQDFCNRPDPAYLRGTNGKFQCPCCQHFTLDEPAGYDICPVCFWEDDGTTGEHGFSPNGITLDEARVNYREFGACKKRDKQHVRKPQPDEL